MATSFMAICENWVSWRQSCGLVLPSCILPILLICNRYDIKVQINQPTRCNSFTSLLLDVHMWLNTFWASPCPSSWVYNCARSLWFCHWKEVAGALLTMVWPVINRPDSDQQRCSHFLPMVQREAPSAVVCLWWWAGRRPKRVEPHMNVE